MTLSLRDVVVVSGARTPVGSFGGSLKSVPAIDMGALVMKAAVERAGLKPAVSDTMGQVAPDALKGQGAVALETDAAGWDDGAAPVTIDEVVMGHVLTAGLGQNPSRQAMIRAGIPKETPAYTVNKVCGSGLKAIALGAASIMTGQADVVLAGGQENMSQVLSLIHI